MRAVVGLVVIAWLGPAAVAPAAEGAGTVRATYAFSWGGIEVGTLEVSVATDGAGYRAGWDGATTGLVGALFPFASRGSAEGRREGDRHLPSAYAGRSEWRDGGGGRWRVAFGPDGAATEVEVPAADLAEREPVPPGLRVGPDPVSLALTAVARAAPGVRLDGRSFDGKRALGVALACDDALSADGGELACAVSGRLLAGASRRWRERAAPGDAERQPVRVWLRRAGAEGDGFWPVRLEAPSRFGTVSARLTGIERTDQPPRDAAGGTG